MFSSICAWTNDWANNLDAGDLRRHRAHYDVTAMIRSGYDSPIWSNAQLKLVIVSTQCGLVMPHRNINPSRYWLRLWCVSRRHQLITSTNHSIENPSMVDPQWNMLYWRSRYIFHTVWWDEVGCEWGTPSVYFGITVFESIDFFPSLPWGSRHRFYYYVKNIVWTTQTKS